MSNDLVITNARIVLREEELLGSLTARDGVIADLIEGTLRSRTAMDWSGDYLVPGLVELHTDNLEKHLMPRPKVNWPTLPAVLAHDAEIAAAGITTVFDALGVGELDEQALRGQDMGPVLEGLRCAESHRLLRAEHYLHIRCELPAPNAVRLFEPFRGNPRVRLLSVMDHTIGQRQWTSIEQARVYYTGRKGWSNEKFERVAAESGVLQQQYAEPNRRYFLRYARDCGIAIASHDDTTPEHVMQAYAEGAAISEFPTTKDAARVAHANGLGTVMGAPNVVRGGSHSGNVSALQLAHEGLLDVLSSDYVPSSLMHAAFLLEQCAGYTLPGAIAMVSANPARLAKLADRGEIALGKRADFSRVRLTSGVPSVLAVWRAGERVV